MTTTTQGTRTALIRARFADMDTLDLETASYLLRGLDDLLFFDWLSGVGESGSTLTLDQQRAYEAWSPVIRRISYNSPLEASAVGIRVGRYRPPGRPSVRARPPSPGTEGSGRPSGRHLRPRA